MHIHLFVTMSGQIRVHKWSLHTRPGFHVRANSRFGDFTTGKIAVGYRKFENNIEVGILSMNENMGHMLSPKEIRNSFDQTTNSLQTSENVKLVCETKNHTIKLNIPENIHMIFIKNGHK